jgi:hypothetical protein
VIFSQTHLVTVPLATPPPPPGRDLLTWNEMKSSRSRSASIIILSAIWMIWDQCCDFLDIFANKLGEKIGVFDSKQS